LPATGGQVSDLNTTEIIALSLTGVVILLLAAITLLSRKSARTNR
jgi:hypothetical protein